MAVFHSLNIKEIRRETSKAVSISFDVPQNLDPEYRFKGGQYLTLKTVIGGQEVRRDYSISSSPYSDDLTITVKEIPNGLFSVYANTYLKIGDSLDVSLPKGRFVLDQNNRSELIVGFAAGSGITPIMSLLKTTLESNETQKFVLVYGNKSMNETIFYDEIIALKEKYKSRLEVQFLFSQSQHDNCLFGRIDKGHINSILKNKIPLNIHSKFFICGPEPMIQTVKDTLLENDILEDDIRFELFTAPQTTNESVSALKECKITITLQVDDETELFEMDSNQTILEAALKQKIDVPYSCQGGVCSSCICRVTKGSAEMRQNSVLTNKEVADGLVLSCQAVPTSSKIYVDFDDV